MNLATLLPLLLELAWKSTLLLGAVLLAVRLLGARACAAERHLLLAAGLLAALALPAVAVLAPRVAIEWPATLAPADPAAAEPAAAAAGAQPPSRADERGSTEPTGADRRQTTRSAHAETAFSEARRTLLHAGAWLYLGVTSALLAIVAGGIARDARHLRALSPASVATRRLADSIRRELGIGRGVTTLASRRHRSPWAWGLWRPAVVVPPEFDDWPEDARRNALVHELAHIRRHDQLTLALTAACVALYWFQPLAWLALRRLRREAENACDDHVLAGGAEPARYAGQLLELARAIHAEGHRTLPAIPMARPSTVTARVESILTATPRRRAVNHRRSVFASLSVLVALGGLGPIVTADSQEPAAADDPEIQLLVANDAGNDAELASLVTAHVAADREAEAVQALVAYLSRPDVEHCSFCSDVLRPQRSLFTAPNLGTVVAPTWSGLRSVLDSAFEQLERQAYASADAHLLVKLAAVQVDSGRREAFGIAAWYLLEGLRLGAGSDGDRVKPFAMDVLHSMGRLTDAAAIAQELYDEPSSRYFQSETMRQWLSYFATEATRLNVVSARLRGLESTDPNAFEYQPLYKTAPRYPQAAAEQGLEGNVIIEFTVAANGRPTDLRVVSSSDSVFEEPALEAARTFRYMPRVVGSAPVEVPGVRNKITFVMDKG